MSDSVWPHKWQPTRLPCPWDSLGKNTGVGWHLLLQCMKVESESEVAQSCLTLSDLMDCSLPGSSVHGIFQARGLEWGAIAFSRINPRKYQIVRTHTKETTWIQDLASPTSSTLCRMTHLNNEQNKNTNPTISRQDYLTQPCPSEEKQTKLNMNLTLYKTYTNFWTNLKRA